MRYITHFYTTEGLPSSDGIRKITFLTTDDSGDTFLGTDNNPLSKEVVEKMISEKKIVALPKKVLLPKEQSLFIDKDGVLYLANRLNAVKAVTTIAAYDPILKKVFQQ